MGNTVASHEHSRIILFDAVCKLCCGWSRFILRFDKHQRFTLCSVQSESGQKLLIQCGLATDNFETMVFIQAQGFKTKSDALLAILQELPMPWPLFSFLRIIPKSLRDYLYDKIAFNRYKIFGRYEQCMLPSAKDKKRFLE